MEQQIHGTEIVKKGEIRVLVCTPTNEIKNYCLKEWHSRVTNLSYPNYDILIADNSESKKNMKLLMKMGLSTIHIKPKQKANQQFIAESHEYLRQYALKFGYDFIIHLESDVIPPHDIIERLLVHRKKIVSATYFIGDGESSHLMIQDIEKGGSSVKYTINMTDGLDYNIVDGNVKEVYACGLGCILIHKSILEQVQFRWENGASAHPDSFFAADLKQLGIKQYLDTSTFCDHKNSSWALASNAVVIKNEK